MGRWIRRVMLIVFWAGVGAVVAGILGMVFGSTDRAVLPFVLGIVVSTAILPIALVMTTVGSAGRSLGSLARLKPEGPPAPDLPRALGRIESLREVGVTIRNFHHLFEFTVTVFPEGGEPRAERFSQLITMGELPNFTTGRYVVLAEAPGAAPGAPHGLRLDPAPDARWTAALRAAPVRYDEVVAPPGPAPTAAGANPASAPRAGGSGTRSPGPRRSGWRTALNLAIVAVCLVGGFSASVQYVFGGFERLGTILSELPQRLSGQVHGSWDSAQLDLDFADMRQQLGDRDLEYLIIFDGYYSIGAYSTTDARGEDVYSFRGGALKLSWTSTISDSSSPFTIDDVDPAMVRKAVAKVYAETPDAAISSVGLRVQGGALAIDVSIDGTYEDTQRMFDAATGEAISEG